MKLLFVCNQGEYGSVDDEIVFNSITEELERDVREFIDSIENSIK